MLSIVKWRHEARRQQTGEEENGGTGRTSPASDVEEHGAGETINDGKGQELVVAGGGLARGGDWRVLTAAEFQGLAAVPAEVEWFANIDNPRTRRAYQVDSREFMRSA